MSDLFIPFNNNPVSVDVVRTSYTVPAGKYARVTASVLVTAYGEIQFNGSGQAINFGSSDYVTEQVDSKTATFFVPSGTNIGFSESAASSTDSGINSDLQLFAESASSAEITIDSSSVLQCIVRAHCYCKNSVSNGVDYKSASVNGAAIARCIVELYNEQT